MTKRATLLIAMLFATCSIDATAGSRVGRPMIIHRVAEMNLEIWTEHDPEWETHIRIGKQAYTFIAETPALTFPPTHMSWTISPAFTFQPQEVEAAALGVVQQMATRYRMSPPEHMSPARYGELVGYEATFQAEMHNVPVDVRVFCGHRAGKPMVVMQVVTLKGSLPHVAEHVRRSWTHVRYLD